MTNSADATYATVGVTRINDWFRLLRALLCMVVPTAVAGMLVTTSSSIVGRPGGAEIVSITVNLVVHTCFWVSLVYAYVDWRERTGEVSAITAPALTVIDQTTAVVRSPSAGRRVALGEVIAPMSAWASFVAFSFGQRRIAPLDGYGLPIPILAEAAWPRWMPFVAWMAANASASLIATFRMGRWTPATAAVSVLTSLFIVVEVIRMVMTNAWISDDYLHAMRQTAQAQHDLERLLSVASLVVVMGVALWTIVVAVRGWRRDRTAPPLSYS